MFYVLHFFSVLMSISGNSWKLDKIDSLDNIILLQGFIKNVNDIQITFLGKTFDWFDLFIGTIFLYDSKNFVVV